uniref:Peptidyl-prolyl cis-trans isomerase n=1 Tax=Odontella aurita TaxID=265563 RepID=A0A7S4NHV5_9STRA|mmetsp:Transcript_7085/g.21166  ORF Transcript_7085/g.21166 Transcript_7085/m.21166 type:complete len:159 (+) Transcript_7085:198-674(+)|eukprot:CAMPEP_0113547400 /NCGR_PEP_ID=MMETSP0015_2-20120614/12334_1 /TAXON_ID=2838 /ORGANISM="Odontella" /LENGTH=158 /DNA_ID=CAMNT_0000447949 /DNA_START=191 /DNA_END=667 /DNA_ORIENTATION=+ /assembly_acc=CAM_ASM_000160
MKVLLCLVSALLLLSLQSAAFAPGSSAAPTFTRSQLDTRRNNLFDSIGSMVQNFGKKATASHILIGPKTMGEAEAKEKLLELKAEIDNDPIKFADFASEFSTCPSSKKGGSLGSFGPGMMVKSFDSVCFDEEVGVVHGPISTQFGEHLILITDRTGDK